MYKPRAYTMQLRFFGWLVKNIVKKYCNKEPLV